MRSRARDRFSWLAAMALVCGCGRESLWSATDAATDWPTTTGQVDGPGVLGPDDAADGAVAAVDGRPRDARRDTPVDVALDGPCQPGFGLCPSGGTAATCIDQRTNQNCGACGRACPAGTTCGDGACVSVCPAGTSYCPGAPDRGCVDLSSSQDHCGHCGHSCGAGQVCREASCQPACRSTLAWALPEMTQAPSSSGVVSMGDLDGDGRLDCIMATRSSVGLWRNQGNGRFGSTGAALLSLDATEQLSRVGVGDFDGDGRSDLLVALYADASSFLDRFLLLTGSEKDGFVRAGTVTPNPAAASGGWAVGDMNGDGRTDLVAYQDQEIVVWLGQADGHMVEGSRTQASKAVYNPLLADLNGDGKLDLVAATSSKDELHVFLGSAGGRLAPAVVTAVALASGPLAAGDSDGDGVPELVVSTAKGALLLQSTKDGRLATLRSLTDDFSVYAAAFFDLDRDGKLDLISNTESQELRIARGNGDGTFQAPERYACPRGSTLTVDDLDGDGQADLAMFSTLSRSLLVFRGRAEGLPGFRILSESTSAFDGVVWSGKDPIAADLNEDGIPDTAALSANKSSLDVTLGGGADAGQSAVSYPVSSSTGLLVLDVDVDGHLDLVVPSYSNGTVTLLLGRGDGTFEQRLSISAPLTSDSTIGFSRPFPGRGRDLLIRQTATIFNKSTDPLIGVATSMGNLCPSQG